MKSHSDLAPYTPAEDRANFLDLCGELYDNSHPFDIYMSLIGSPLVPTGAKVCEVCWSLYRCKICPTCAENQPLEPDERPELTDSERNK